MPKILRIKVILPFYFGILLIMEEKAMYEEFIRNRITELRMKKGVSEYKMSYDLGHNKNYIRTITSGSALPSVSGLLNICEYFEMSPSEFFERDYPQVIKKAEALMMELDEDDLLFVLSMIQRLVKNK